MILTDEERATLERWSRRAKRAQALALRCRIVLACATRATNNQVAAELGGRCRRWQVAVAVCDPPAGGAGR